MLGIGLSSICFSSFAGAPFFTDDPELVDYQHWEALLYSSNYITTSPASGYLQLPSLELDWGAFPNVTLHLAIPAQGYVSPKPSNTTFGIGDTELGFKYRFIDETEIIPQFAFAPLFELPTGNAEAGLGNGAYWMVLPVWLEKNWGHWRASGGGGYVINTVANGQNYFYGGGVVQKQVNEKWRFGIEIYAQGQISANQTDPFNAAFTMVDLGINYDINKHLSLLFSGGYGVIGQPQVVNYMAIHWKS